MGKLLVHLHLYYQDQADYFLERLSNITVPFKLIVTLTSENADIRRKFLSQYPDAEIMLIENSGYDVYPFFQAMKSIDLSSYEYILKIHTKSCRDTLFLNRLEYQGYEYRDNLVTPLIGSKRRFRKAFKTISSSPETGMVCSKFFLLKAKNEAPLNHPFTEKLCLDYGITYDDETIFCAGTMFICRREIVQFLLKNDYSADDYGRQLTTGSTGTLAHSMETMFGLVCRHLGYKVKGLKGASLNYSLTFLRKTYKHKDIRWLLDY